MKYMKVPRGTARKRARDKARSEWEREAPKVSLSCFVRSTKENRCSKP